MSEGAIAHGRYRIERRIARGAMADVLLARDAELDRPVAIKLLDEQLVPDAEFRARFAREARVAAALSHPNVVTVFDVGEEGGRPYIVMEYVEGRTLAERLRAEGPLPGEEVRRIALQVCDGLEHAHAEGLVHRDLKPANLIERGDGTVKIADFGIARAAAATQLTEAGTIVGTAAYLAPEQAEGREVTPATDLFALGVVLYELLAGRQPWKIETLGALGSDRAAPPPLPPEAPASLRAAIERCLAPDPRARPSSAAELRALLTASDVGEEATVVLPRVTPQRAGRRRERRARPPWARVVAILTVVLLASLVTGLVLSRVGGDDSRAREAPARAERIPRGATPAENARLLADWLRENSG